MLQFIDDPDFPYVGKFVANLTLAQLRTIDCGSLRQGDFRKHTSLPIVNRFLTPSILAHQLTYPDTRISTMEEVFDFVQCVDTDRRMLWNIESKIDARYPNRTADVLEFVQRQHEVFEMSGYKHAITVRRLCIFFSRKRVRAEISII